MIKTPISYYGGKQNLLTTILPLIPKHNTYVEPFVGGGAIFWSKPKSEVEIINDNNRELINFYEVVQSEFVELEKMIRISLHSRSLHNDATVTIIIRTCLAELRGLGLCGYWPRNPSVPCWTAHGATINKKGLRLIK